MASVKDFISSSLQDINEGKNVLSKVMEKVSDGDELSERDKEMLSAAIDTVKGEARKDVDRIMKKVRNGEELSYREQSKLGAAIDAAKDAQNESVDYRINEEIGDSDLRRMADEASKLAKDIPGGESLANRLSSAKAPAASTVRQKLAQAQKMVEELKEAKKKIAPLKDGDKSGRKALKQTFQRIITGLRKMQGIEKEAERVLAELKSKGDVAAVKQKWDKKKADFKSRVKENLKGKKQERVEKVKSMVGKAKAKARHSIAKFSN